MVASTLFKIRRDFVIVIIINSIPQTISRTYIIVNLLLRILHPTNTLKLPPLFWSFFAYFTFPPYFDHDASCVMLNIEWTPLRLLTAEEIF